MTHEFINPISQALVPVVRGICIHPGELQISERFDGRTLELRFSPHMGDLPLIIGPQGRQVRALIYVGKAMGRRAGITVDLQVNESYRGERDKPRRFRLDPGFTKQHLDTFLNPVVELSLGPGVPSEFRIDGGTFKVHLDVSDDDQLVARAIGDLFFAFGMAIGRRIEVKPKSCCEIR